MRKGRRAGGDEGSEEDKHLLGWAGVGGLCEPEQVQEFRVEQEVGRARGYVGVFEM